VVEGRPQPQSGADLGDPEAVKGTALAREQVIAVRENVLGRLLAVGLELPSRFFKAANASIAPFAVPGWTGSKRTERELSSPAPATIVINQLQGLLIDQAKRRGIEVRYAHAFEGIKPPDATGRVTLQVRGPDGAYQVRCRAVIGADGTRSRVRQSLGIGWQDVETQGQMLGVWFKGGGDTQRDMSASRDVGESGILLQSGKTLYALLAMPRRLAQVAAKPPQTLTVAERRLLYRHARKVAAKLLPADEMPHIHPSWHLTFPAVLSRATTALAPKYKAVLVGDANQSLNPYTGRGANLAMLQAYEAGVATAESIVHPAVGRRLLREYGRHAADGAAYVHWLSHVAYGPSFGNRPRARRIRAVVTR
jgi:2-polyprenyl-6-methoxyphenol hydroxylase-like FAD-dependent oxidoreductase